MTAPFAFRIGVDENGMGPRLGPMLVTAVLAATDERGHKAVERRARGAMKTRVGDSKELVSHGDVALGEAWARVLAEISGHRPATVDDVVRAISLDAPDELRRPCPDHVRPQCWGEGTEALSAPDDLVAEVRRDVKKLEKSGVRIVGVRSVVVCTKRLNEAVDRGLSRFIVDLHSMERLVLDFRERAGEAVLAVCGKVGGLRQYEPAFGPLSGRLCTVLEERKERSAYHFPGVGEMRFLMDADGSDKLVSIASLVGKYLREVLMARIVRHYGSKVSGLPDASGYHDRITNEFVEATALVRRKAKVPADCFERRAIG
jgi:ribonuclease HII